MNPCSYREEATLLIRPLYTNTKYIILAHL